MRIDTQNIYSMACGKWEPIVWPWVYVSWLVFFGGDPKLIHILAELGKESREEKKKKPVIGTTGEKSELQGPSWGKNETKAKSFYP